MVAAYLTSSERRGSYIDPIISELQALVAKTSTILKMLQRKKTFAKKLQGEGTFHRQTNIAIYRLNRHRVDSVKTYIIRHFVSLDYSSDNAVYLHFHYQAG